MSDVLQGFFMCRKLHSWKRVRLRRPREKQRCLGSPDGSKLFNPTDFLNAWIWLDGICWLIIYNCSPDSSAAANLNINIKCAQGLVGWTLHTHGGAAKVWQGDVYLPFMERVSSVNALSQVEAVTLYFLKFVASCLFFGSINSGVRKSEASEQRISEQRI